MACNVLAEFAFKLVNLQSHAFSRYSCYSVNGQFGYALDFTACLILSKNFLKSTSVRDEFSVKFSSNILTSWNSLVFSNDSITKRK